MRAKGKKIADAAGRLGSAKEQHRTPQVYRNNPAMSIQKKQNRKTIYHHIKQPTQKRNDFRFWLFQPKTGYFNKFF